MKRYNTLLLLILIVFSLGLSSDADQLQPMAKTIEIVDFSFQPSTVTVPVGTAVTWINRGSTEHTVTSADGKFESGSIASGSEFKHTFSQLGTYSYHCSIHPAMTGQVVVTIAQANPAKVNAIGTNATQPSTSGTVSALEVGLKLVAQGFTAPIEFVSPEDNTGRMFLVDQIGLVKVMS